MANNIKNKTKLINFFFNLTFFLISISGFMSILVVLSRTPYINSLLFKINLDLFKKFLVFHVDFSLYFWMNAFIFVVVLFLVHEFLRVCDFFLYIYKAIVVTIFIILSTIFFNSKIFLINYIPLIDNFFFLFFFFLFFFLLLFLYFFLFFKIKIYKKKENKYFNIKNNLFYILFFYFINYFLVFLNLFFSYFKLEKFVNFINDFNYYELLVWAPGHCLQFINSFTLLLVFCLFLEKVFFNILNKKLLFLLISLYFLINTLFYFFYFLNIYEIDYYLLNTYLMKYNSFFYFIICFIILLVNLFFVNECKIGKFIKYLKFYFLTIFFIYFFGCFLGSLIDKQNTIIPAHYHCSIGSVTLSFFVFSNFFYRKFIYFNYLNFFFYISFPFFFFVGQIFFSLGFLIAGFNGTLRKSFLNNQIINSTAEKIGLIIMAIGGSVAIISGFCFVLYYLRIKNSQNKEFIWI